MNIHTNTNRDPGPKLGHFLEKALEVKELEHHISLSTLGSPQREEDHRSVPHLVDIPINCSLAPALPSGSPWAGAVPVKESMVGNEGSGDRMGRERTPQRAE